MLTASGFMRAAAPPPPVSEQQAADAVGNASAARADEGVGVAGGAKSAAGKASAGASKAQATPSGAGKASAGSGGARASGVRAAPAAAGGAQTTPSASKAQATPGGSPARAQDSKAKENAQGSKAVKKGVQGRGSAVHDDELAAALEGEDWGAQECNGVQEERGTGVVSDGNEVRGSGGQGVQGQRRSGRQGGVGRKAAVSEDSLPSSRKRKASAEVLIEKGQKQRVSGTEKETAAAQQKAQEEGGKRKEREEKEGASQKSPKKQRVAFAAAPPSQPSPAHTQPPTAHTQPVTAPSEPTPAHTQPATRAAPSSKSNGTNGHTHSNGKQGSKSNGTLNHSNGKDSSSSSSRSSESDSSRENSESEDGKHAAGGCMHDCLRSVCLHLGYVSHHLPSSLSVRCYACFKSFTNTSHPLARAIAVLPSNATIEDSDSSDDSDDEGKRLIREAHALYAALDATAKKQWRV